MKATLETIVGEARELFRDHGYAGASMQDLATRVGIKKASLYTRFSTKEALVKGVLELTAQETLADLPSDTKNRPTRYEALIRRIAEDLSRRGRCVGLHLAYGIQDETPEAAEAVREYFRNLRQYIADTLTPFLPKAHALDLAADSLIRLEGATLWIVLEDDTAPMERVVASLLAEVQHAIKVSARNEAKKGVRKRAHR